MKAVIIVSPYFPPSAQAGVHRARHLARYLPAYDWRPIVLRVHESYYEEKLDHDLATLVPEVEIVATTAIPISITRPLAFGDLGLRGYFALRSALTRLIRTEKPGVVFLTGSPFYPLLLARHARRLGVKVVVDLQDPWVSDYGADQPFWTKRGLSYQVARLLEPLALRAANAVTSVSPTQNQALRDRYEFLQDVPMVDIPIGGDPDDFAALRRRQPAGLLVDLPEDRINLNYVGTHLPRSGPLVQILFQALRQLLQDEPELRNRLQLNFIGTSNQLRDVSDSPVMVLAEDADVADVVYEYPRRVPFLEALYWLACADGVLMIGSDERHYTASKIYPGLMSGRPFLALFHEASTSHQLLSTVGNGITFGFSNENELNALVPDIKEGLRTLVLAPETMGTADPEVYRDVSADAVAARYAALFTEVVAGDD